MTEKLLNEYELLKESIEKNSTTALSGLRPGTVLLLQASSAKEPEGAKKYTPRLVSLIFAVMNLNSAVTQLKTAYAWLPLYPLISVFIFAKELIGFVLIISSGLRALRKRPYPHIYGGILDMCSGIRLPGKIASVLNAVLYAVGSLSNLREVISLAVAIRWGVDVPLFLHEFDVQKVGNLIFVALNIAIKAKNDEKAISSGVFLGLITSLPAIMIGIVNHYRTDWQLTQFMADLEEGKIGKEELALALESLYQGSTGQKCSSSLIENILIGKKTFVEVKKESGIKKREGKVD
jgi:hypothetical protein